MNAPRRDTTSGRVYLDLRARARQEGRPTDELFVLYVLERFLYRLSISPHRQRLVLKGGMLLAALDQRRPTRDVDLLATPSPVDVDTITEFVREIVALDVDDGVTFELDRMTIQQIREHDPYVALRIVVPARIARAQHPLKIDVNVGDPVTPAPVSVTYPALLGDPFALRAYPIETVLAEKLITMIHRGDSTTRERDFADVLILITSHRIVATQLSRALTATAAYRQTSLQPLRPLLVTLAQQRGPDWDRYRTRARLQKVLPATYESAITHVTEFADPILDGTVTSGYWDHHDRRWKK